MFSALAVGVSTLTALTALAGPAAFPTAAAATTTTTATTDATLAHVLRINAGGGAVTTGGVSWAADTGALGGTTFTTKSTADIAGTTGDVLYRSERVGAVKYELPIPSAGDYVVRLHFAEIWFGAPGGGTGGAGKRVFSMNLEGGPVELADYDIAREVGAMRAVVKQFPVTVTDGKLSISASARVNNAKISALEVLRRTSTPPPTTSTPPPSGTAAFGVGWGRPWSPATPYNQPIPANPVLDAGSRAMVAQMSRTGRATANLYDYADPVFDADAASPEYMVKCLKPWGTCDLSTKPIRIPADARPTPGTDGRMIIVDWVRRESCDFWQARKTATGGWETSWGTCAPIDGDGRGPHGGATGAGINALAGVVRTYEMRQGKVDHALSLATDNSCTKVFRYPAIKTDGASSRTDCIPEGARIQLDPTIDVDAIPGITQGEKVVAKALQTYGAYNRDNAGSPMAFAFESPIGESDPYPAVGFGWDYYDMPHIPWHRLRVLRQWDGQ